MNYECIQMESGQLLKGPRWVVKFWREAIINVNELCESQRIHCESERWFNASLL